MTDRQHDTVTFDAARVALKGASDLEDSIVGGLRQSDRARITVEGVVTERKEIRRTNGLIEWVKVIEVDRSYNLEVIDRLTEIPFPSSTSTATENPAPLTVDTDTGEVTEDRGRQSAKEPARG